MCVTRSKFNATSKASKDDAASAIEGQSNFDACDTGDLDWNSRWATKSQPRTERDGITYAVLAYQDGLPNPHVVKVGRTSRPLKVRMAELRQRCPGHLQLVVTAFFGPHHIRTETIAHERLEEICSSRPVTKCSRCPRSHQELFVFDDVEDLLWDSVIPTLHAAAHAAIGYGTPHRGRQEYNSSANKRKTWRKRVQQNKKLEARHPSMHPYLPGTGCPLYFLSPTRIEDL
ncbi:hypothetical protein PM082_005408 [Marasmius tenuissimus]|nr:hypothetical protein PM082_005408 [Marasmius tenuissimus]